MEPELYLIWLYLKVEDLFRDAIADSRLRQRGFEPSLSDVEVITIELFAEYQGYGNDKAIWRYIRQHWFSHFPQLCSYKNFTKHSANLMFVKEKIFRELSRPKESDLFHIVDGVPLPVCKFARAKRCKLFNDQADFGHCAAKQETFFGFKGHLVINDKGEVRDFNITPANCDEREALLDMGRPCTGDLIADKGYIGQKIVKELQKRGIYLHTPLRSNMKDHRPRCFVKHLMNKRRYIESVLHKLIDQFSLLESKARDLWHLSNKIYRKLIAYNLALKFHGATKFLES